MPPIRETVLLYCPGKPKYLTKLKGTLVQMGIRIRMISPAQVTQTVGYLAGLPDYEELPLPDCIPEIPQEVLVMKYFTGSRMDQLFSAMRRLGIPRIDLKAVVTDTNAGWSFYELYEEIKKEHEQMTAQKGAAR